MYTYAFFGVLYVRVSEFLFLRTIDIFHNNIGQYFIIIHIQDKYSFLTDTQFCHTPTIKSYLKLRGSQLSCPKKKIIISK